MATLETFATRRGWTVKSWDPFSSGLPNDAFDIDVTTLLIGIADSRRHACNVTWLSRNRQWCFITELLYNEQDQTLAASDVDVRCGSVTFHFCQVHLSVVVNSNGTHTLTGNITHYPFVEGNTGTFIAEADPVGEECEDQ